MPKKRGKTISFDAMVKFFMQQYNLPTRNDMEKIQKKLDRIEKLIKTAGIGRVAAGRRTRSGSKTASDEVLDMVKRSKKGVGFNDLQARTGFPEKKLRNIIYRLNDLERIKRKTRGIYVAT